MLTAQSAPQGNSVPPLAAGDGGDWLEAMEQACFGGGLSDEVDNELQLASRAWHAEAIAEAHLRRAFELAPRHPATHIALYRFYFYRNRLREALAVGLRCLDEAARVNQLASDWREVRFEDADFGSYAVLPRFYLFTLKACAYLQLRLGALEQGEVMLGKLLELDPADRVNGSVLRGVLDRLGRDDEE